MVAMDVASSVASDLTNAVTDYSVDAQYTDAGGDQKETTWDNVNWTQYFGYYKEIPELNSVIDAKATWTVGKGFEADEATKKKLNRIKGWGKDSFNTILENAVRVYQIGGDAFCEIIRDKAGRLINLKPLSPDSITIVVDDKGMLKRYEQNSKIRGKKPVKFEPEDMFHLARNRVADEMHGVSIIEKLQNIILMRNEAMSDYKQVLHRFVKPRWIIKLDTDDTGKINAEKSKWDKANENGENMYIPMGSVEAEQMSIADGSSLNPQEWISQLNDYFYQATGVPKIIVGEATGITEAGSKILYLAFQQTIEEEQLFIEEQVKAQLNLEIDLEFPASLEADLMSDTDKDGEQTAVKPNEVETTMEGKR